VADAIRKGGTRDFWQLSVLKLLPQETREYVPAVLAARQMGGASVEYPAAAGHKASRKPGTVVYAGIGGMQ
jgi:hypothetical protein